MMLLRNKKAPNLKMGRPHKNSMRATCRYVCGYYSTAAILFSLLIFNLISGTDASQVLFEAGMPVVVIDPGHGGNDSGAKGPAGIQEKTVTLNLARSIADQLKTRCRVVLTRSDDYRLDISERTAVANQAKADIFISLHTGSSFIGSFSGETVYFYRQFLGSALTAESETPQSLRDSDLPASWDQIQAKYRITSQKLAKLIQYQLNNVRRPQDTKIQGAPLLVLEGADMPAVAIEIGNLSNPNEEKALGDTEFLAVIARAITKGIDAFFAEKAKR
jgi:N-acetylmuramoyl-L-alanine amidase